MRSDRTRLHLPCWGIILWVFLICLVCATDAWARAGGGGGFSGGGGGGGGGFGGGGGGGDADPVATLIAAAIAGVFYILKHFFGKKAKGLLPADRPTHVIDHDDHVANVAKLTSSDPDFTFDHFSSRVEHAFLQIQAAWCAQDMTPVRAYVSDSLLERFSLQIAEQIREGYRDHMPDINVHRDTMQLAALRTTKHFEIVDIYISCDAVDVRVSLETGQPEPRSTINKLSSLVQGQSLADAVKDVETGSFVEFWSFLRRRGVRSRTGSGLFEGHCPNCGSSLVELNQVGECGTCEAVLRGGEHDWILAEITQASQWRPPDVSSERQASIEQFQSERDSGFTTQHAEDRGSVIFWRKATADRTGSIDPLRKMATDQLCERLEKEMAEATTSAGREFWHDCSVGSVDCLGIISEKDTDYLLLTIHSSGNRHRVLPNGQLEDLDNWSRLRTLFVLRRNSGITSRIERTITSAHCPSCGAPDSDIASHSCLFCNEVVNDGRHDWVLHDISPSYSEQGQAWRNRLEEQDQPAATRDSSAPGPTGFDVLAWVIQTVAADKTLSPEENTALLRLGKKHHVPRKQLEAVLSQASRGQLDTPAPPDKTAARRWLTIAADAALCDGEVDSREEAVLLQLGSHAKMANYDIKLLLAKRQARLARQKS